MRRCGLAAGSRLRVVLGALGPDRCKGRVVAASAAVGAVGEALIRRPATTHAELNDRAAQWLRKNSEAFSAIQWESRS